MALTVKKIRENIYLFNEDESMDVDAYLIIGSKKAIMVDGLMDTKELLSEVRRLTDLPLAMLVAHGHPDHAGGGTKEFIEAGYPVYMCREDFGLLAGFGYHYPEEAFCWIEDGMTVELGNQTLEIWKVPGHTHGSCVIYCPQEKVMFSSDSFGSGNIWIWLEHSKPLCEFKENLAPMLEFLREHPDTIIYPGHTKQIPEYHDGKGEYLDLAYVEDLMQVTADLIAGIQAGVPIEAPSEMMAGVAVCNASGKIVREYTYDADKVS